MFKSSTSTLTLKGTILGPKYSFKAVDSVGLFSTETYISGMYGGHSSGKTSSFKQYLFLKDIRVVNVANILVAAIKTRPSPLYYLYLLQGSGAVSNVEANATAFGYQD